MISEVPRQFGSQGTEKPPDKSEKILDDLRLKCRQDKKFGEFMGNEQLADLDFNIAPLIYTLWEKQIVNTSWSCSGHIGKSLLESGGAITPGFFVFQEGFILFKDIDPSLTDAFFKLLEAKAKQYPFIAIRRIKPEDVEMKRISPKHMMLLKMDDLATYHEKWHIKELPENLARERLALFYKIWNELTLEVLQLRK